MSLIETNSVLTEKRKEKKSTKKSFKSNKKFSFDAGERRDTAKLADREVR